VDKLKCEGTSVRDWAAASAHHVQLLVSGGKVDGSSCTVILSDIVWIGVHYLGQLLRVAQSDGAVKCDRWVLRHGRIPASNVMGIHHHLLFILDLMLTLFSRCRMLSYLPVAVMSLPMLRGILPAAPSRDPLTDVYWRFKLILQHNNVLSTRKPEVSELQSREVCGQPSGALGGKANLIAVILPHHA